MYFKPDTTLTPKTDKLENDFNSLTEISHEALRRSLSLCHKLEREMNEYKWKYEDCNERS